VSTPLVRMPRGSQTLHGGGGNELRQAHGVQGRHPGGSVSPTSVAELERGQESVLFAECNTYAVGGVEAVDYSGSLAATAKLAG
jgi:hypothetical protein